MVGENFKSTGHSLEVTKVVVIARREVLGYEFCDLIVILRGTRYTLKKCVNMCLRESFCVESLSQLTNWTLFRYGTILMYATESGNSNVPFLRVSAPIILFTCVVQL